MRTNIVINDQLMDQAIAASGLKTKRKTIEEALRLMVRVKSQQGVKKFKGKLHWVGDLESMRKD